MSDTAVIIAVAALAVVLAGLVAHLGLKLRSAHNARQRSETSLTTFSSAVRNSGAMIIITDDTGTIEFLNDRFCELTGFEREDMLGQSLAALSATVDLSGTETGVTTNFLDCLQPHWKGELLCRTRGDTPLWTAVTTSSVLDDEGRPRNYIVSAVDMTELKVAHRHMEQLALFDSLTGLANRRLFQDRLEQALQSVNRRGNQVALLFLDLDDFKGINDRLGHEAGDMLLLTVADRLRSCVRCHDTVARMGGDEFTILLHDVDDAKALTMIAENILSSLKNPIRLTNQEVIVSTSIGITTAPADGDNSDVLMRNADLALYRAKDKGRDQYDFYTETLNDRAERLMGLERELRTALKRDEFTLLFQPQVDLNTREITTLEALIRWNHPERGEILPDEFVPVAEDTGLITPIGNWVMQNACMQIKLLHQLLGRPMRVAINLSARQFRDPSLESVIQFALSTSGLEPQYLELEVTESMLMDDIKMVREQLGRIKATGVTVTVDDFGTGYCCLSELRDMPVDLVKIDGGLIEAVPQNPDQQSLVRAIVAMAQELDLSVLAEGVENVDQENFLRAHGCDLAQGYHFSAPMSFDALYEHLSEDTVDPAINA